jgi:nicotinamide phosphoribosyltransferase
MNILTLTDSYKFSHYAQYPKGTERVFSYFESRAGAKWAETVFFGLQYFLKEYLIGQVVTAQKIAEAKALCDAHIGPGLFNEAGWTRMLEKHDGRLPVQIRAVPEGYAVPTGNALMTIENTDTEFPWLTNYLETLLVQVWYPSTVATQSREMKKKIRAYLEETGDPAGLDFKLHDFGFRGVSSVESAGIGGAAHLVNFHGTDTVRGLEVARDYYRAGICGFSIPASEHSTITSWGEDGEANAMRNMLEAYPKGLVACVSDSWDIYRACRDLWGGVLKDKILARDGALVIRPDSGDPVEVLPQILGILWGRFGGQTNAKGYKVLAPQVRLIQGDGITHDSLEGILEAVKASGFSADNLAFGSGGGLLQHLNRDTQRFAFKCSAIQINGEWQHVYKQPKTDPSKASKRGRVTIIKRGEQYETLTGSFDPKFDEGIEAMQTVFQNGMLMVDHKFDAIRARAVI